MDNEFVEAFLEAVSHSDFVKLTFSKPKQKQSDLRNMYIKPVLLKGILKMSVTYKYLTRQEVKNFSIDETSELITGLMETFRAANLLTLSGDFEWLVSKSGQSRLTKLSPAQSEKPDLSHDKLKQRRIDPAKPYWFHLGLTDKDGRVLASMQHKFKQVDKYISLLEPLIQFSGDKPVKIVDMGSGKGYLTFALYEYLSNVRGLQVELTGVEQRPDMVMLTNRIAGMSGLQGLRFVEGSIGDFAITNIDVLIALHACDTATDDAIAAGIRAKASVIVCAPCCHKQIRNEISAVAAEVPVVKYGILLGRQAEILTDTLRALIMEWHGYKTQVMEFIEAEHTPKNIMLAGVRKSNITNREDILRSIQKLKSDYRINTHYLEKLLEYQDII